MSAIEVGRESQEDRDGVPVTGHIEHSARQISADERALMLADLTQSIAAMEGAARVEAELAKTLTAMAAQSTGVAADRRRMLAEDACQGARAATKAIDLLRDQARKWTV